MPKPRALELALLVLLSFLWGGSFTLIKVAVETIPPATIVAVRVAVAALFLMLVAKARGLEIPCIGWLWSAFFVQGSLQSALPFTLISWGEKHIDSGLAGLINSTPPLFVFLITFLALRRDGDIARRLLGVLTGFAGVILVLGVEAVDGIQASVFGQLAVTGASFSYALAAIYGRRFKNLPPVVTAGCAMTMAALLMTPLSLYIDRPWILTPNTEAVVAVVVLAVFSTAFAMIIYFRLLGTLGALGITSGSYLRAGFSVAFGVSFLGEPITWSLATGFVLIVAGVAILNSQLQLPSLARAK